jgi:hypothetical protein
MPYYSHAPNTLTIPRTGHRVPRCQVISLLHPPNRDAPHAMSLPTYERVYDPQGEERFCDSDKYHASLARPTFQTLVKEVM